VTTFFTEEGDPVNLAIFRIVFFVTILGMYASGPSVLWFSSLPRQLLIAPVGMGWLLPFLPINQTIAYIASVLFIVCCCAGLLGFLSRTSSFLVVLLGFFVLGIPQFFGKVDHFHHFLWFAGILAASRSGDALSVDAAIAAWKKAKGGLLYTLHPARGYALPLRFVWLLLGIIYLFPGLWKVWHCGLAWALSDNIKFQMYTKWLENGSWSPLFRLDHFPTLYKFGGLGTIGFEVSFIVMVLFKKLRPVAALLGLGFHEATDLFMGISFIGLYVFYLTFIDWASLFRFLGRKLFHEQMVVLYDGNCTICKTTIGSVKAFDRDALHRHNLGWLDEAALVTDMHAVVGTRVFKGFASYRALAARIPPLWLIQPFLWVWPVPRVGRMIYRHVADHRACDFPPPSPRNLKITRSTVPVLAVGTFLIVVNVWFGVRGFISGWPFACYPTFSWIQGPEQTTLEIAGVTTAGTMVPLVLGDATSRFTPVKFWWLVRQILWWSSDEQQRASRLGALWQVLIRIDPSYGRFKVVRFYEATLSTVPEEWARNPVRRSLIYEMHVGPGGDGPEITSLPPSYHPGNITERRTP